MLNRTVRYRHAVVAATLMSPLALVAACGQSSAPPSATPGPHPVLGASFTARATAVCTESAVALQALGPFPYPAFNPSAPDPADFPGIAAYEAKNQPIMQGWDTKLHQLGNPPSGTTQWRTFLAAADKHVIIAVAQQQAAEAGDAAAFTQTYDQFQTEYSTHMIPALSAVGLPSCDPYNF